LALSEATAAARRASGSSFYNAMRILPRAQREAMFEIYSFCRQVDDIADSRGSRATRRAELQDWREDIDALYAARPGARTQGLISCVREFGLRREDFHAVIDGMEMDVDADICAPDEATLELYCDRVASAVGRLSVRIFGMDEADGILLAHLLGRALQLTNILRDIDEDAAIGRLYLPREYLELSGVTTRDPKAAIADPKIDAVCCSLARDAHGRYAKAAGVLEKKPKGRIATPRLMGAVYGEILRQTEAVGWKPPRSRVSLGKAKLLGIVLRNGLFG